jgi:hypothetical protein
MRIATLAALLLLGACATTSDVSLYRRDDSSGGGFSLNEYSVKDATPGPHAARPPPELMGRANIFCARQDGKAAVIQEQEDPPSGVYVFRCVPRAFHAIAQ